MRHCCLSCALVHAFRQQVALWDQKFSTWRWVIKKKRERETAGEKELSPRLCLLLSGTDTMKLSHVQMEASQAANRSLRDDGKERLENVFFFSFFVPKMLAFNCEIRVSFVLTRECIAGERLSYCSGDFGQESSNSGSPSTQQGFFLPLFTLLCSRRCCNDPNEHI